MEIIILVSRFDKFNAKYISVYCDRCKEIIIITLTANTTVAVHFLVLSYSPYPFWPGPCSLHSVPPAPNEFQLGCAGASFFCFIIELRRVREGINIFS